MAVTQKGQEELSEGRRRSRRVRPPPEGGWGWMVVAGCFLATVCTRGVTRFVDVFSLVTSLAVKEGGGRHYNTLNDLCEPGGVGEHHVEDL